MDPSRFQIHTKSEWGLFWVKTPPRPSFAEISSVVFLQSCWQTNQPISKRAQAKTLPPWQKSGLVFVNWRTEHKTQLAAHRKCIMPEACSPPVVHLEIGYIISECVYDWHHLWPNTSAPISLPVKAVPNRKYGQFGLLLCYNLFSSECKSQYISSNDRTYGAANTGMPSGVSIVRWILFLDLMVEWTHPSSDQHQ